MLRSSGERNHIPSGRFRFAVAIGLLFSVGAQAQQPGHTAERQPAELCEAFPWDVPVEHSFSVDSVLRWRQASGNPMQAEQRVPLAQPGAEQPARRGKATTWYGQSRQIRQTADEGTSR